MTAENFDNKVAFVTGAASGIGLATAQAFAAAGAAVALVDLHEEAADSAAADIRSSGGEAIGIGCDVADESAVASAVERTINEFGRLDAAFNNAGMQFPPQDTAEAGRYEFDRVLAVNLGGVFSGMKYQLQQMVKQGSGTIVNCSSVCGLVGVPGQGSYHASKHGIIGLTRTAALEYAKRGIRINAVCPGTIETPLVKAILDRDPVILEQIVTRDQPIGRLGRPEEVAAAVLWLSGPGSSFVIGHPLAVDGGWTAQ